MSAQQRGGNKKGDLNQGMKSLIVNSKKKVEEEEEEEEEEEDEEEDEDEDEEMIELPPTILKRVEALRKLHGDVDAIDEQYKAERVLLEAKYEQKRQVLYEGRKNIVVGTVDVEGNEQAVEDVDAEKGIPNFWLQAFGNHPIIADIICEHDIPALGFLTNVSVAYNEDYTTFTLSFDFKENPFFTNKTLQKRYTLTPYLLDEKNPSLAESSGTVIEWKAGKNLMINEIKKKQKAKSGKNKGQIRTIVKEVPRPSFFHYFSDPKDDDEEDEEDEEEEGEKERIELNEEEDFEIAHAIRTAIIPDAVLWFTGEASVDDYDDEEEEEEEDDEEEDDEEDDDDEEEEVARPKGKGKGPTHKPTGGFAASSSGGKAGEQPECKQN